MAVNKLLSEFIGTYFLVYTVGSNVTGHTGAWAVTSIACVLMIFIYALGAVSGGHFNPAVTTALGVAGKIEWGEGLQYMVAQILGGLAAGFGNSAVYNKAVDHLNVADHLPLQNALIAEFLYTFMLAFVVLNVACTKMNQPNEYYGLAIGFVVIAGGYGAGAISGGCFNPAVAIGLDVSSLKPKWCGAWAAVELSAGVVAALAHRAVHPEEYNKESKIGHAQKFLSEFLGTFFLCLTVGLNVGMKSPMGAWSIAASLMCMIYALGSVSGAHFNPAVTVSILMSGRDIIAASDAIAYIIIQCIGGCAGMLTGVWLCNVKEFGPLGEPEKIAGAVFGTMLESHAEMVFTFVLCFVVLSVATTREPSKDMFGLAIGSCVTVGGVAIGGLTGGCLNPAVALGVTVATTVFGKADYSAIGLFAGFEVLGGALAAALFFVTHKSEYEPVGKGDAELLSDEPEEVI